MGSQVDNPHQVTGGNGDSLEIFLFFNGQHDSPPRKYNVRVSERWDATLNSLARLQYGSKHAIEVYTIDGEKLGGAQELANGTAYVAVEPPAAFQPGGYHDYLAKASRSREKRQERIHDSELDATKVTTGSVTNTEEENKAATNVIKSEALTINPNTAVTVEKYNAITDKVRKDIAGAIKPIKRMSTIKQTQKRNSTIPQQNPAITRKKISNVSTTFQREFNIPKVDTIRKKSEMYSVKNTNNSIVPASESKSKIVETVGVRARPYNQDHTATNNEGKKKINVTSPSVTYSELVDTDSEYINPFKVLSTSNIFAISQDDPLLSKAEINAYGHNVSSAESPQTELNEEVYKVIHEESPNKTILFGSQTGNNNFAIHVKHGDTLNLKLNIEVKSGSSAQMEIKPYQNVKASPSLLSTVRTAKCERGILVNNIEETKKYRDMPTLTEAGLAELSQQLHQLNKDLTVAVCECNCYAERAVPVIIDNNNYIILYPLEEQNKNSASYACKLEVNQKDICDIPRSQVLSTSKTKVNDDYNVQVHVCSGTKTPQNSTLFHAMPYEKKLISRSVSIVDTEVHETCDSCITYTRQKQLLACNCAQRCAPSTFECDVCAQNRHEKVCNIMKEAFTQTVGTGLVLEARLREDGSYGLYMPSLEVLKLCNALY